MTYRDPESYKPARQHEGRDFENSLFAPVEKVQADGFHQQPESTSELPVSSAAHQERGISQPEQDITFNLHRNNPASNDANLRVAATKETMRQEIYKFAILNGSYGITIHEIVSHLKIAINTASPRLTELKRDGLLTLKGSERRNGACVHIPLFAEGK